MKSTSPDGSIVILGSPSRNNNSRPKKSFYPHNVEFDALGGTPSLTFFTTLKNGSTYAYQYAGPTEADADTIVNRIQFWPSVYTGSDYGGVYFNSSVRNTFGVTKTFLY